MSAFDYGSMGYDPGYAGGAQFPPLTPPPPVPTESSGGGFGNFLNSNFMSNVGGPLLSAGLSGMFTNQAANRYGQSAREAAFLGGQAALLAGREAAGFSLLGEDIAQQRRQEDALFQLNLQRSKPFQNLVAKSGAMQIAAQDSPGSDMRAGRFMAMFG
tara:strand:+ start:432 stop:905 length:474 start_codon:yes stop_codon:yes gene_type:complete